MFHTTLNLVEARRELFPWQRSTQHPRTAEVTIGIILERLPKIASTVTALFMFLMTPKRRSITAARSSRGVIGKGSRLPHILHHTAAACCLYHIQVSIFPLCGAPSCHSTLQWRRASCAPLRPLNLVCQRLLASRSRIGQKRQFTGTDRRIALRCARNSVKASRSELTREAREQQKREVSRKQNRRFPQDTHLFW